MDVTSLAANSTFAAFSSAAIVAAVWGVFLKGLSHTATQKSWAPAADADPSAWNTIRRRFLEPFRRTVLEPLDGANSAFIDPALRPFRIVALRAPITADPATSERPKLRDMFVAGAKRSGRQPTGLVVDYSPAILAAFLLVAGFIMIDGTPGFGAALYLIALTVYLTVAFVFGARNVIRLTERRPQLRVVTPDDLT
jgi:hypothetical protein